MIIQVDNTLVSSEILDEEFVCNISSCKGLCCVEGDAGAPLEDEETAILSTIYPKIKSYLTAEGVEAIEAQGSYVKGLDGGWETPLVEASGACAYASFDEQGNAFCTIEKAHKDNVIAWKKPISCHLYPIRLSKHNAYVAANYNRWHICHSACSMGKTLKISVYVFLKEALVRKFGEDWYAELATVADAYMFEKSRKN